MKTKLIVVACCLFLFVAVISGCNLQKMVAVQVPAGVRKSLEIDAGTNLHNAEYVYASWQSFVEVNTQELLANIDSANKTYSTLASFVNLGFDVASNHAGAIPGGGLVLAALTGLGGLFVNRPGTRKLVKQAKADAFRQGMNIERASRNK